MRTSLFRKNGVRTSSKYPKPRCGHHCFLEKEAKTRCGHPRPHAPAPHYTFQVREQKGHLLGHATGPPSESLACSASEQMHCRPEARLPQQLFFWRRPDWRARSCFARRSRANRALTLARRRWRRSPPEYPQQRPCSLLRPLRALWGRRRSRPPVGSAGLLMVGLVGPARLSGLLRLRGGLF